MFNKKRIIIFVVFILLMFFMTTFAGTPVQNAAIAMRDVIFTDGYNGRNLAEYQIEVGKDVTPPETPKHEGYAFAGWYNYTDRSTRVNSFKTILNDLHVIALYGEDLNKNGIVDSEEEHYLVSFVNSVNYEVIKEEEVLVGMDATAPSAPAMSGYRFMGWDRSYRNIRSDLTVYTVYNRNTTNNDNNDNDNNPKTYTVTFIDGVTNKKISSVTVREGLSAGTPNVPTHEGKTFDKWEGNYTNVKKNETVTAVYKDIKFSVLFLNDDGSELQFEEVVYGTMAAYNGEEPTKAATAQYTYTFNGWDKELAKVYENVTYTATYSKTTNKYTVKFVNHDGNELQNTKLEYGKTPAYNGATPTKPETAEYTYTFAGWDKEITEVTGDVTYTATFEGTKKQYLIKFLNYEGTELQSERLDYGELPVYKGDRPTKPATAQYTYTFRGWDKQIREVTVNESYIAQFKETINSYTVKFVNDDGTELQSSTVNYGVKPSYTGETPTKEPTAEFTYTFKGWDKEITEVTGDVTYTATYDSVTNEYTIKFVNEDGTELQSGDVAYGVVPTYNAGTPTKAATAQYTYTFAGWDKEVVAVTGEATYTATYSSVVNEYTVTFVDEDGRELQSSKVAYGTKAAYNSIPPFKEPTAQYTYTFTGWDKELADVTADVTYTATYSSVVNEYTIKFVNYEGTELQSTNVAYGTVPRYTEETPTRAADAEFTYTFTGWDKEIVAVTGEATYTATYTTTTNKYTIKFVNDGTELQSSEVAYGTVPTYNGQTPTRTADAEFTYTFEGWDNEVVAVTGNATYNATYSSVRNKYTIKFVNEDGTELQNTQVEYGAMPAYNSAIPTKASTAEYTYTFNGWDNEVVEVVGDATYTATFSSEKNKYTIKFVNDDNSVLQNTQVEYGVTPVYSGQTPTKEADAEYTYTFKNWDKPIVAVTGEETYKATYTTTKNKYTVTWKNEDGSVLETDSNVEYGATPKYDGATPTKEATAEFTYTFAGWDKEITAVEGNVTYTATYTSKTNSYKVEIDPNCETGESCTKPEDQTVDYGKEATLPTISRNYKLYFSVDGNTNVFTPMNASATLLGYCLEGTDCSELVEAGTKVTVTGNAKYKAVWNNEGLTITGDLPTPSDDVEHGKKFINWTETSSATSNVVNTPIKLTSDKTIYAHFGQTKIKVEVSVGGDIANGNIEYDQELIYTIKITNEGDLGGSVFVSDPKLKEAIANGLVVLASGNTNEAKAIVEDGLTLNNVTGSKTITLKVIVKANAGDKVKTSLQYKVDGYDKTPVETTSNVEKTITFIGKSERLVGSNVVIVIDKSASMDENGKAAKAKAAAKAFIDSIFVDNNTNAYGTTISVVTFGSKCKYADEYQQAIDDNDYYAIYDYKNKCNNASNHDIVKVQLENVATDYASAQLLKAEIDNSISDTTDYPGGSGTPYYAAFELANEVLVRYTTGSNKNDNQNVVIFLTDGEPSIDDETKRQTELDKLDAKKAIIYAIGFDMVEYKCTKWNFDGTKCKKYSTTEKSDEYKLLKRITDYQHSDGYDDRVIMSGVSGLIEVFEGLGSKISSEPKSLQTSNGRLDMGPVIAVNKKHPIIVSVNGTEATASNEVADNSHEFIVYSGGVKDNTRTFTRYTEAITQRYLTHDDETGYDINAAKFNPADKIKVEFFISYSE